MNQINKNTTSKLYSRALVVYILVLTSFLLWPFDFAFSKNNNARWIENSNGIEFTKKGQVLSLSNTKKLYDKLLAGTGFSLELWIASKDTNRTGPARIISYSLNTQRRNFTLGQEQNKLVLRLRTTNTDLNGIYPHMEVDGVFDTPNLRHIVVTYDFSEQSVYVNGERRMKGKFPEGRFDNWDPSYHLVIGNEVTGDRPWLGKIFFAAIYNQPLDEHEIRQGYLAGWHTEPGGAPEAQHISRGLVTRYLFQEGNGDKIHDSSGSRNPLDLYIPREIKSSENHYLSLSYGSSFKNLGDVILNIVAFIFAGFLLHATLRSRYGSSLKISLFVLIIGTLFSFCVETLQHFSPARHSSLIDMFSNIFGITLGIAADRAYSSYLKFEGKLLKKSWLIEGNF